MFFLIYFISVHFNLQTISINKYLISFKFCVHDFDQKKRLDIHHQGKLLVTDWM